jgi:hypothetical protein
MWAENPTIITPNSLLPPGAHSLAPFYLPAGFAWVHFRQYVLTQDADLLNRTKALLQRLAQAAPPAPPRIPSYRGLPSANGAAPHHYPPLPNGSLAADDASLTQEVSKCVISWVRGRLEDYHASLEGPLGGAGALPGLVEVFSCAALAAGASLGEVQEQLVAALHSSVDAGGWGGGGVALWTYCVCGVRGRGGGKGVSAVEGTRGCVLCGW